MKHISRRFRKYGFTFVRMDALMHSDPHAFDRVVSVLSVRGTPVQNPGHARHERREYGITRRQQRTLRRQFPNVFGAKVAA